MTVENIAVGDVEAILAAGAAMNDLADVDPDSHLVRPIIVPGTYRVEYPDRVRLADEAEKLDSQPFRRRGEITVSTVDSFIAAVDEWADGRVAVFRNRRQITAVFNPDTDGSRGWWDDIAVLTLEPSTARKAWESKAGVQMTQDKLAEHLEDRLPEIVDPDGADILEMVTFLATSRQSTYQGAINLANGGRRVEWTDDVKVSTRGGSQELPGKLRIEIPLFAGDDLVELTVRLRYTLTEGRLTLAYTLPDLEDVETKWLEALDVEVFERLETNDVGVAAGAVVQGTPRRYR